MKENNLRKRTFFSVGIDDPGDNVILRKHSDVIDVSLEEAIDIISDCHLCYHRMSYKLRSNKKIALHYIKESIARGEASSPDVPFELMNDHEILCKSINFSHEGFQEALKNKNNSIKLKLEFQDFVEFRVSAFDENDSEKSMIVEVALEKAVMFNYNFFQFSPECRFINDNYEYNTDYLVSETLIHKWLEINGLTLKFMPDEVKNDGDMVREAVNENQLAVQFAPTQLIDYFIEDCIERGLKLKDLEKESRSNPAIALSLVRKNPLDFRLLPEKLRDNHEIAMTAVMGDPKVFMFVSDRLKDNYDLACVACGNIVGYNWEDVRNYRISYLRIKDLLDKKTQNIDAVRFALPRIQKIIQGKL